MKLRWVCIAVGSVWTVAAQADTVETRYVTVTGTVWSFPDYDPTAPGDRHRIPNRQVEVRYSFPDRSLIERDIYYIGPCRVDPSPDFGSDDHGYMLSSEITSDEYLEGLSSGMDVCQAVVQEDQGCTNRTHSVYTTADAQGDFRTTLSIDTDHICPNPDNGSFHLTATTFGSEVIPAVQRRDDDWWVQAHLGTLGGFDLVNAPDYIGPGKHYSARRIGPVGPYPVLDVEGFDPADDVDSRTRNFMYANSCLTPECGQAQHADKQALCALGLDAGKVRKPASCDLLHRRLLDPDRVSTDEQRVAILVADIAGRDALQEVYGDLWWDYDALTAGMLGIGDRHGDSGWGVEFESSDVGFADPDDLETFAPWAEEQARQYLDDHVCRYSGEPLGCALPDGDNLYVAPPEGNLLAYSLTHGYTLWDLLSGTSGSMSIDDMALDAMHVAQDIIEDSPQGPDCKKKAVVTGYSMGGLIARTGLAGWCGGDLAADGLTPGCPGVALMVAGDSPLDGASVPVSLQRYLNDDQLVDDMPSFALELLGSTQARQMLRQHVSDEVTGELGTCQVNCVDDDLGGCDSYEVDFREGTCEVKEGPDSDHGRFYAAARSVPGSLDGYPARNGVAVPAVAYSVGATPDEEQAGCGPSTLLLKNWVDDPVGNHNLYLETAGGKAECRNGSLGDYMSAFEGIHGNAPQNFIEITWDTAWTVRAERYPVYIPSESALDVGYAHHLLDIHHESKNNNHFAPLPTGTARFFMAYVHTYLKTNGVTPTCYDPAFVGPTQYRADQGYGGVVCRPPQPEICDGLDNDGDEQVDEGLPGCEIPCALCGNDDDGGGVDDVSGGRAPPTYDDVEFIVDPMLPALGLCFATPGGFVGPIDLDGLGQPLILDPSLAADPEATAYAMDFVSSGDPCEIPFPEVAPVTLQVGAPAHYLVEVGLEPMVCETKAEPCDPMIEHCGDGY